MSEIDDERLSAEAERAREALAAAVREERLPRADAALRSRLRDEFASGRIEEREPARGRAAEGMPRATGKPRVVPARRPWFALPTMRATAVAAAAAALILVAGLLNQGTPWTVLHGDGGQAAAEPGVVEIDGVPTPTTDLATLASRIKPGAELRMAEGGPLRLASGRALALELPPGAELTLPPPPARWVERQSEIYSRAGEIRITTGPAFRGARLAVHTDEAVVELTGTTVAVIRDESGTCACVLDGVVRMGPAASTDPGAPNTPMTTIPAGIRCLMFKGARPPLMEPITDMERMKLSMFRDTAASAR